MRNSVCVSCGLSFLHSEPTTEDEVEVCPACENQELRHLLRRVLDAWMEIDGHRRGPVRKYINDPRLPNLVGDADTFIAANRMLCRILHGAQHHPPGQPFDATRWPLDCGELMWRGLLSPTCVADPDVMTEGGLQFVLTKKGKETEEP